MSKRTIGVNILLQIVNLSSKSSYYIIYTGDFTKPQQKFATAGENCDFVIAVNFYPVQRTF